MIDLKRSVEKSFGCTEFPHALFYAFEDAFRFELGGEGVPATRPLKRFIQAFERADFVARQLFESSHSVWLLSSAYGDANLPKKRLKSFKLCGRSHADFVGFDAVAQNDTNHIREFGGDLYRYWDGVKLQGFDMVREVLWLALGTELGIRPASQTGIYLVDFESQVVLHPYDDRGMDVIAMEKGALSELYDTRKSWLLEYDLDRMAVRFED